jgi:hypothetical protein
MIEQDEKGIKRRTHDGVLVGVSAFWDDLTNAWGVSALYEIDEIHPSEGWSFVVSGPISFVNEDRLIHDMMMAFRGIGRVAKVQCDWRDDQPDFVQRRFVGENKCYKFNPMNVWPKNRRHHDVQVYAGKYHPSEIEQKVVVMAPSENGRRIFEKEMQPRIKAGWNPKHRWHENPKNG